MYPKLFRKYMVTLETIEIGQIRNLYKQHLCQLSLYYFINCVVFISNQVLNPHSSLRVNFITKNTIKYIYYHCYYGNRADKFMKMYYFRPKMSNKK